MTVNRAIGERKGGVGGTTETVGLIRLFSGISLFPFSRPHVDTSPGGEAWLWAHASSREGVRANTWLSPKAPGRDGFWLRLAFSKVG